MGGLFSKLNSNESDSASNPSIPAAENGVKQQKEEKTEVEKTSAESLQSSQKEEEKLEQPKVLTTEEKDVVSTETSANKLQEDNGKDQSEAEPSDNACDISLLTEASRVPIPNSPYVDQSKHPVGLRGREGLGLGKAPLGPSPLTFEAKEKSTEGLASEAKDDKDKNLEKDLSDDNQDNDADKPVSSAESEDIKLTSEINSADKMDTTGTNEAVMEVKITENSGSDKVEELSKKDKKDEMRTGECQILEDTSVTKDVSVHQEMVLPVEELAEQFSNVVISTAAKELQAEQSSGKQSEVHMDTDVVSGDVEEKKDEDKCPETGEVNANSEGEVEGEFNKVKGEVTVEGEVKIEDKNPAESISIKDIKSEVMDVEEPKSDENKLVENI